MGDGADAVNDIMNEMIMEGYYGSDDDVYFDDYNFKKRYVAYTRKRVSNSLTDSEANSRFDEMYNNMEIDNGR